MLDTLLTLLTMIPFAILFIAGAFFLTVCTVVLVKIIIDIIKS